MAGVNQLCQNRIARVIFETARRYHDSRRRYVKLLLLMPDHMHMLIGFLVMHSFRARFATSSESRYE